MNDDNNSFTITRVRDNHTINITLPVGNYPYKLLYQTINLIAGGNICTFDKIKNKFRFTFDEPHSITFNDNSYKVLGFTNSNHTGTMLVSNEVMNPYNQLDNLCVHLTGVQPYRAYNLDNMVSTDIVVSNLLCAIPFNASPYDMLNWVNTGNQYQMYIHDKRIEHLRFRITDFKNAPLSFIPNFTMTLKVETYKTFDEDESLITLRKILEYTKMNFLSKHS